MKKNFIKCLVALGLSIALLNIPLLNVNAQSIARTVDLTVEQMMQNPSQTIEWMIC